MTELPVGPPVSGSAAQLIEALRLPSRASRERVPKHSPELHARRLASVLDEGPEAFANVAASLFAATHGDTLRESVWTYMGYGPFSDRAAFHAWLTTCAASEDPAFYLVFDGAIPIGLVGFLAIRPEHGVLELGHIWFVPGAQAQGLVGTVGRWMLAEAFARGYRRVEWKCDALNARSRKAAAKLGFTEEGTFRQHLIVKGRNRDTTWFSLLDSEWAAGSLAP